MGQDWPTVFSVGHPFFSPLAAVFLFDAMSQHLLVYP